MKTISQSETTATRRFCAYTPHDKAHDFCTWYMAGSNFILAYTEAENGARLAVEAQPDEYMILLPDSSAMIRAGGAEVTAGPDSLTIAPPGASEVEMTSAGRVVRLFSTRNAALARAAGWTGVAPGVTPLEDGPPPVDGYRLRHYRLAEHTTPGSPMRVFRTRNLMLNALLPRASARDTTKLTPHSHMDFEQGSLALEGHWMHHLRYPWTPDLAAWRDDEHLAIDSPSLIVIPPKVIHTSRNTNDGPCWLVDVFAPPRDDFPNRAVMRNAHEYA